MIPCAPKRPGLVVTFCTMEIFHAAILPCPQLSIQAFVRMLCNLHHYPIVGGLREQFSICYDVFITILNNVELRVMKELGRLDPDWQLKNCCATCTFELEGEEELEFCIQAMPTSAEGDRISSERDDLRDGGGEYILQRVEVDCWSKEAIGDVDVVNAENASPCKERWKNMSDERTSKMWGVFEETGFFLSLCCHGSMLVGADMVKSEEQAKYPLAVVARLLQVFGDHLGIGYDIGCKFDGTVHRSPLGELAKTKMFCILVGLFHGHAHNRLCQLQHLGTYLKGLGLEDLETLERFFSKSNALAGGIYYASRFHCCQRLSWYLKHIDHSDSFKHLNIIDSYPALQKSMWELGVADEKEFEAWLREEEVYLTNLWHEPPKKTTEMEYYARLVHYYDIESKVAASNRVVFVNTTTETQPHLLEKRSQELERVQDLERSLNISPDERWMVGSEKWKENEQRVAMRTYRRLVARIFELTKMNMSHTGKALKAHSQAIWTALNQYNAAAAALSPPRLALQWDRVVEYVFLANFDLLRDVRQDMSDCKWATPAGRQAMDTYFKILVTYMHVENVHLCRREAAIADTDAALALQIAGKIASTGEYTMDRGRDNVWAIGP
ncbi:hypothetical protein EDD85DRAFT_922540 [Armillaria nabsnona]|nr:hypothetical protein EDD85DRAFT_922540 [Armillaria nabsnona]